MRIPTNRQPTHPGEMLLEEFLKPMSLSQADFAKHLGWTYAHLNEIINGRRGVSADSALALSEALKTDTTFWMNLQMAWDLWHAKQSHKTITPIAV